MVGAKDAIKAVFRRFGFDVRKASPEGTMNGALRRFAATTPVATVIDVGASDGRWSQAAMRSYPDAHYLLIEALPDHEPALRRFARSHPGTEIVLAAAGDHEGDTHFAAGSAFGGVASYSSTGSDDIIVPMTTIDAEVSRRGLSGPFLMKLDTHGFEVPILEGAKATLGQATLLVIEAYNFTLVPGALRFYELCIYLEDHDFRPADVVDVMYRPADGLLWQFDLCFLRASRPEFRSASFA